jgi:hypothetical protein
MESVESLKRPEGKKKPKHGANSFDPSDSDHSESNRIDESGNDQVSGFGKSEEKQANNNGFELLEGKKRAKTIKKQPGRSTSNMLLNEAKNLEWNSVNQHSARD